MPTVVTTGQITIVDNNDARPITAVITANPGTQQVFTKDESVVSYLPDWTLANTNVGLILTPRVYLGSPTAAVEITSQLTNRRFSTDLSTAITGAQAVSLNASLAAIFTGTGTYAAVVTGGTTSLTIKANMLPAVSQGVIYFEGDYTDTVTGLVSRIVAQISLGMVKTGTNAVHVLMKGRTRIRKAHGTVKNVIAVRAELTRAAGLDTSGVTYQWFDAEGGTQISTTGVNAASALAFASVYGLITTSASTVVGALANIGQNIPALSAFNGFNTLVIHEDAIAELDTLRCIAKDSDGTDYQVYFTVNDISDPYALQIISTSGDKLQNGIGTTTLSPKVFYGADEVTVLTGWTFDWTFFNRNGLRGAFVDTTKTALAGGRPVTANTVGVGGTVTYTGATIAFAAGDIIKLVTAAGVDFFYEVLSNAANVVTMRTPVTNTWLVHTAPTASQFVGGVLYACVGSQGQKVTAAAATFDLTGDEVDAKARISCVANRP